MEKKRILTAAPVESRDETAHKDSLLTNTYAEETPIGFMSVKRPGLVTQSNGLGVNQGPLTGQNGTTPQLFTVFTPTSFGIPGTPVTLGVLGDTLFTGTSDGKLCVPTTIGATPVPPDPNFPGFYISQFGAEQYGGVNGLPVDELRLATLEGVQINHPALLFSSCIGPFTPAQVTEHYNQLWIFSDRDQGYYYANTQIISPGPAPTKYVCPDSTWDKTQDGLHCYKCI